MIFIVQHFLGSSHNICARTATLMGNKLHKYCIMWTLMCGWKILLQSKSSDADDFLTLLQMLQVILNISPYLEQRVLGFVIFSFMNLYKMNISLSFFICSVSIFNFFIFHCSMSKFLIDYLLGNLLIAVSCYKRCIC